MTTTVVTVGLCGACLQTIVPTSRAPLWLLTASWSTNKIAVNKSFFDEETISNKRAQSNLNRRGGYGQLPFEIKIGKNGQINRLNAGWGWDLKPLARYGLAMVERCGGDINIDASLYMYLMNTVLNNYFRFHNHSLCCVTIVRDIDSHTTQCRLTFVFLKMLTICLRK